MANKIVDSLHNNPIIAAASDEEKLNAAQSADVEIVFILNSTIFNLDDQIKKVQTAGKMAFVHVDLVDGISSNKTGIRYICEVFKPDGIITTKGHLISAAKKYGVMTIQRVFLLDSLSLETGIDSINACNPDAVEILPNVVPKIVTRMVKALRKPIITGGLITEKEDIMNSLKAGAMGISTSTVDIWGC